MVVDDDNQTLLEMESTLPSEGNPEGTFTPVNLASELKVQVRCLRYAEYILCRCVCVPCYTSCELERRASAAAISPCYLLHRLEASAVGKVSHVEFWPVGLHASEPFGVSASCSTRVSDCAREQYCDQSGIADRTHNVADGHLTLSGMVRDCCVEWNFYLARALKLYGSYYAQV